MASTPSCYAVTGWRAHHKTGQAGYLRYLVQSRSPSGDCQETPLPPYCDGLPVEAAGVGASGSRRGRCHRGQHQIGAKQLAQHRQGGVLLAIAVESLAVHRLGQRDADHAQLGLLACRRAGGDGDGGGKGDIPTLDHPPQCVIIRGGLCPLRFLHLRLRRLERLARGDQVRVGSGAVLSGQVARQRQR